MVSSSIAFRKLVAFGKFFQILVLELFREVSFRTRVLTRGMTYPRKPATRGLFLNPGHDPRALRGGAFTRVKSASTDVGYTRVGNTFFGSGREKREEKEEKSGKMCERASGGARSVGPKIPTFCQYLVYSCSKVQTIFS